MSWPSFSKRPRSHSGGGAAAAAAAGGSPGLTTSDLTPPPTLWTVLKREEWANEDSVLGVFDWHGIETFLKKAQVGGLQHQHNNSQSPLRIVWTVLNAERPPEDADLGEYWPTLVLYYSSLPSHPATPALLWEWVYEPRTHRRVVTADEALRQLRELDTQVRAQIRERQLEADRAFTGIQITDVLHQIAGYLPYHKTETEKRGSPAPPPPLPLPLLPPPPPQRTRTLARRRASRPFFVW